LIFVTVGTTEQPFDRLMKAVDTLHRAEPIVVQYGFSTYIPRDCSALQFLSFEDMKDVIRKARVVVCHAGAGSVLTTLCFGKRPIAAPRLKRFNEMVDDHQMDLVEAFEANGMILRFMPGDDLGTTIAKIGDQGQNQALRPSENLIAFLNTFVTTR
jgi:UDP-N-acetylglucosamine transferase subunit ALG13